MEKDFWKWHSLKSEIEKQIPSPLFYEREIWWCSVGANVGAEEDGESMTALLSQLRVLSAKRLRRRMSRITEEKCAAIAQALVYLIIP
jgi:mRNA-degrading endonuclease toxin of MazEF toxin-antitoxin module